MNNKHLQAAKRSIDPVVSATAGGAQGRSSWERVVPKAQYRPKAGKNKKTHEVGLFFWFPLSFSDASSRSGLTQRSPTCPVYRPYSLLKAIRG